MTTATLSLVPALAPVLREKAAPVTDIVRDVLPHLEAMQALMRERGGVGLAAPQVGLPLRFFVTALPRMPLVINPVIHLATGGRVSKPEGCLSFPGRTRFVVRAVEIEAEWQDLGGSWVRRRLFNWEARVFQHEADHLEGLCIFA